MQQSPLAAAQPNWRGLARSVALGASVFLGIAWGGVLVIAVLTYQVMSRMTRVAVTWDLGRWNTWGFVGHVGNHTAAMHVAGIWWILLPPLFVAAACTAVRLRSRPAQQPNSARLED